MTMKFLHKNHMRLFVLINSIKIVFSKFHQNDPSMISPMKKHTFKTWLDSLESSLERAYQAKQKGINFSKKEEIANKSIHFMQRQT